jgi:UDP-4-amino-4,6-dideoxy-N-acetyl-beta-L-altrosamine transaminase
MTSWPPKTDFLPYSRQTLDDGDIDAVVAALRSPYLTTGPVVERFEARFAEAVGAPEAVVCSNGTAALHIAAMLLDLQPTDRVIVPSLTFLATANAVRYVGAEVIFADVDPDSGLMGPAQLEEALARGRGQSIKAVFPVHLGGQVADQATVAEVAARNGLRVVDDACHALGTIYGAGGDRVGACRHADISCFSLHAVKAVTMGEGGVLTMRDRPTAERARRLRSHGMVREPGLFVHTDAGLEPDGTPRRWYYEMQEPGFNYRATDFQCALGFSQLEKLDRFNAQRTALVARYDALLKPFAPVLRPVMRTDCRPAWHLYVVLIDFERLGMNRNMVMARLHDHGIGTQVHYIPVHCQPYYRQRYGAQDLHGADAYYARCLSLPLFPTMTTQDVDRVVEVLESIVKARSGGT